MTTRKSQRLYFIILVLVCFGFAAALSLYALRDNISYFYTPTEVGDMRQLGDARVAPGKVFRVGGLVQKGSLEHIDKNLRVRFTVTDTVHELRVDYKGILPDLFREGQGVVAKGALNDKGTFIAAELLAKHDEKYMPPEVKKSLDKAHADGVLKMTPVTEGTAPNGTPVYGKKTEPEKMDSIDPETDKK